jgi:predicted secreted protein with PEFG-CTERM motif
MKTKTIGSLIVLLAVAATIASAPSAFAEHSMNAVVENAVGSSTPGCEPDCFLPATVTIGVGGMVEFVNGDNAAHTSTAGTPQDGPSGVWDSSLVMVGMSFTTPALEAGEYPYFCMVHPWMTGLVIVEEESHDDHAMEEMDHSDMGGMEMATLTAADIAISVNDGAAAGEKVAIDVTINGEHVNYDIVATHNGETILDESDNHSHTGEGSHTTSALSADASDDNPIDVTVTFQGFGMPGDDKTGPIGLTNTAQAVPEFGTIAAMILVVAIVSIIVITSKSRLSLTPKL